MLGGLKDLLQQPLLCQKLSPGTQVHRCFPPHSHACTHMHRCPHCPTHVPSSLLLCVPKQQVSVLCGLGATPEEADGPLVDEEAEHQEHEVPAPSSPLQPHRKTASLSQTIFTNDTMTSPTMRNPLSGGRSLMKHLHDPSRAFPASTDSLGACHALVCRKRRPGRIFTVRVLLEARQGQTWKPGGPC